MRFLIQRVKSAKVTVEEKVTGEIESGLLIFAGFTHSDNPELCRRMLEKTALLRIFDDQAGKMNLSLKEIQGSWLIVSQFTLYANARKGNRPSYTEAMKGEEAQSLFKTCLKTAGEINTWGATGSGIFAADMQVSLLNSGPVTIMLDSSEIFQLSDQPSSSI